MCGQNNRRGFCRNARQAVQPDACCRPCGCGCSDNDAPTATISMADYQPFILVPTSVFDQGDVDCGCSGAVGSDW